ncbi:MAG: SRPBCC family protein [Sphingopyxis sp.]|uniref:SRPBCC family protein n=1 Tax=Sphingopyxis sp. TaxID=1908224 RepID=UPI002ABC8006|nr:SRPBCC family protein [Sphingopyxis sp.]MDZ3830469.1 SRPBCC family protein [Sphingopyxis sp.]
MTDMMTDAEYGVVAEPATLTISRLLPGPIDRLWTYLIDSDLRRKWLAAGAMEQQAGAPVELVWRNDELMNDAGTRPDGFAEEDRMTCCVTEIDAPRQLGISWGSTGGVTFTLEERGAEVLLTVTHHRVADRSTLLDVSAGWHAHLDLLVSHLRGTRPAPYWDEWSRLRGIYDKRLPA